MPRGTGPVHPVSMSSTSNQTIILSILYWAALSDGELDRKEVEVIEKAADLLAESTADSMSPNRSRPAVIMDPSEEELGDLLSSVNSSDDRQLIIKLVYQLIACSRRDADTCQINQQEKSAYRRLVAASKLTQEKVDEAEWAAKTELKGKAKPSEVIANLIEKVRNTF